MLPDYPWIEALVAMSAFLETEEERCHTWAAADRVLLSHERESAPAELLAVRPRGRAGGGIRV
jgi:hypothetical protein